MILVQCIKVKLNLCVDFFLSFFLLLFFARKKEKLFGVFFFFFVRCFLWIPITISLFWFSHWEFIWCFTQRKANSLMPLNIFWLNISRKKNQLQWVFPFNLFIEIFFLSFSISHFKKKVFPHFWTSVMNWYSFRADDSFHFFF